MSSIYELAPQGVRQVVPEGSVGFYRLGHMEDGQFWPHYIGRSDNCLQERLLSHAQQRNGEQFEAMVTDSLRRAFELECRAWHLWGERLENDIHPARPKYIAYQCPYCTLETELGTSKIEVPR